jgi:hypothetical protein
MARTTLAASGPDYTPTIHGPVAQATPGQVSQGRCHSSVGGHSTALHVSQERQHPAPPAPVLTRSGPRRPSASSSSASSGSSTASQVAARLPRRLHRRSTRRRRRAARLAFQLVQRLDPVHRPTIAPVARLRPGRASLRRIGCAVIVGCGPSALLRDGNGGRKLVACSPATRC